uniref:Uncharacterized protein n=1 Tax=Solanum lycopersicum TaxID=4081 RepID=A0A3Q7E8H8_SOLLC
MNILLTSTGYEEVQSSVSHRIYSDCSRASGKEEQEHKDMLTCLAKCQTSSPAVAPHKKAKRESLFKHGHVGTRFKSIDLHSTAIVMYMVQQEEN